VKISSGVSAQYVASIIFFMHVEGSRNNETTKSNNNHNNKYLCHVVKTCSMLRGVGWYLVTDVAGQPISPIFVG
jgi:hypothetical protein